MNHCAERVLAQMLDCERAVTSGVESRRKYLATHELRFTEVLRLSRKLVPDCRARVLDIGRSELTACLASFYQNIYTLGFDPSMDDGGHREAGELSHVSHITFDLLSAARVDTWPQCGPFDLIVFSEVIEHLHVAPVYVLALLESLLSPGGALICTTPNAVCLANRIQMLGGRNPYEPLRLSPLNPGHIREYTRDELICMAARVGLTCTSHFYNDWLRRENGNGLKKALVWMTNTYPVFRRFQTFVFVRSGSEGNLAGVRDVATASEAALMGR